MSKKSYPKKTRNPERPVYPKKDNPKYHDYYVSLDVNATLRELVKARDEEDAIRTLIGRLHYKGLNPAVNIAYAEIQDEFGNIIESYLFDPPDLNKCYVTESGMVIRKDEQDLRCPEIDREELKRLDHED